MHEKLKLERWEQDKLGVTPIRTWDEAVKRFLDETSDKRTHAEDIRISKWFHPRLGGKALSDINRETIEALRQERAKKVSNATINRTMAFLRAILRRACFDWEWLQKAPKVPMFKVQDERIRSLTREEYKRLLSELPLHLRDMTIFSVATGLRQSNVKGLKWDNISFERRHMWIHAAEHKNGKFHPVPLNDTAIEVLERRKGDHPRYVFTYDGEPIIQVNTKAWRNALKRAGIENFRWHDLRHTFATWQRENGTPTYELQRLGGWKTQAMVERYAHVAPEGLLTAAMRIDNYARPTI